MKFHACLFQVDYSTFLKGSEGYITSRLGMFHCCGCSAEMPRKHAIGVSDLPNPPTQSQHSSATEQYSAEGPDNNRTAGLRYSRTSGVCSQYHSNLGFVV